MAKPTSPFSSATRFFAETTGEQASNVALNVGISQNAIIGAVANEYDTRYNYYHDPEIATTQKRKDGGVVLVWDFRRNTSG